MVHEGGAEINVEDGLVEMNGISSSWHIYLFLALSYSTINHSKTLPGLKLHIKSSIGDVCTYFFN